MSLIITSNVSLNDKPDTSNVFKPYSYRNNLLNTLKIPANSQIALQSAKFNKTGLFELNAYNTNVFQYFGETPADGETTLDSVCSHPSFGRIAPLTGATGEVLTRSPMDMAVDIEAGLIKSIYHPVFHHTSVDVALKRGGGGNNGNGNGNGNGNVGGGELFDGYDIQYTQKTLNTSVTIDQDFRNLNIDGNTNFTDDGAGEVLAGGGRYDVQFTKQPVSPCNGVCEFDIAEQVQGSNKPFYVGLSRFCLQLPLGGLYAPPYFNPQRGASARVGRECFGDIMVYRTGTVLRICQSVMNSAGVGDADDLVLQDIVYYGFTGAAYPAAYDMQADADQFTKIRFTLNNEKIDIHAYSGDSRTYVLLSSISQSSLVGVNKNSVPAPLHMGKWHLYPIMSTRGARKLTLDNYQHLTHIAGNLIQNNPDYDWWCDLQQQGLEKWCHDIENRPWNDMNHIPNGITGLKGGGTYLGYVPDAVPTNNGYMEGYVNKLITAPSILYGKFYTASANTANTLGFVGMSVAPDPAVAAAVVQTISSISVPKVVNNVSLFVRVNNLTQSSVNGKQGTSSSKIIAHLPRFDNGGNEVGGLYFEPHERVYLDLNNPNELFLNEIDLDIVYDNEVLCTSLTGKTIVVLHIRKSP